MTLHNQTGVFAAHAYVGSRNYSYRPSYSLLWSPLFSLRCAYRLSLILHSNHQSDNDSQIAKAELAKVRQQRQFELETVNIQGEGQERWKKKYVYWIPALHIEGKEVAKGRWDAQTVNQALDTWEASPWTKEEL